MFLVKQAEEVYSQVPIVDGELVEGEIEEGGCEETFLCLSLT